MTCGMIQVRDIGIESRFLNIDIDMHVSVSCIVCLIEFECFISAHRYVLLYALASSGCVRTISQQHIISEYSQAFSLVPSTIFY